MSEFVSNDPLHGITLKYMLEYLVEFYCWFEMSRRIRINCFAKDPLSFQFEIFEKNTVGPK
jgi:uncharacterized protein (DUF2132 family)